MKTERLRKRVGIWIRVSTEDQAKGESPEHHERRARGYAESKEWDVIEVYDLAGVSGKNVWHHPECQRMLADVREKRISGLIFSHLARLARNTKQLLEFRDFFKQHDADMISLADSIDTTTPAGRLFYTMNAAMAEWERESIADRVAASVPIRAKLGKSLGGVAPFGYAWRDKRLVVDENEAPIRRLVYDLFLEHQRKNTVARLMNQAGHRMRSGKPFTYSAVARILTDPVAMGVRQVNRVKSKLRGGGTKPATDWVEVEVPAIISPDVFEKCQEIMRAQLHPMRRPARKVIHLFAGFLFCECGKKMYVPQGGASYICAGCRNRIGKVDLENLYNSQLKGFFYSSERIAEHLEQADRHVAAKRESLSTLQAERSRIALESDKLYRLYQEGNISGKGFAERNKALEERIDQLDTELPKLEGEVDYLRTQLLSSNEVIAEAQNLQSRWFDLTADEKRAIVEAITDRIVIGNNEVTIHLSYNAPTAKPPPASWKERQPAKSPRTLGRTHRDISLGVTSD